MKRKDVLPTVPNKLKWGEFPTTPTTRKIDVHGVRKENLKLKEQIKLLEARVKDNRNRPIDYSRAFTQAKPTTDNGAMRVAGYQPLPKAGPQRTMVGDGTNPLVRY